MGAHRGNDRAGPSDNKPKEYHATVSFLPVRSKVIVPQELIEVHFKWRNLVITKQRYPSTEQNPNCRYQGYRKIKKRNKTLTKQEKSKEESQTESQT